MMGLRWRIIAGAIFFAILAIADLTRRGTKATRWREYSFLLLCVAVAMLYGVVNDQVTSRISWEYFYYGKELAPIIGAQTPPDTAALSLQAARIGAEATWTAGLIIGVAMLLANNPSKKVPRVSYASMIQRLPVFVLICVIFAVLLGIAGHFYLLNWMGEDFGELAATNLWRPRRFMTVYGVHLGGYIGGVVGVIYSVWSIRRERKHLRNRQG